MSLKHPIIAVTGSSGAGTTTVQNAFLDIFRRQGLVAARVNGDAFRRYDRAEMQKIMAESINARKLFSHFGPAANQFDRLEALFQEYSVSGGGETRRYLSDDCDIPEGYEPGSFTLWEPIPGDTDLLFYEGLHGGVVSTTWTRRSMSPSHNPRVARDRRNPNANRGIDVAQYVDLLIGVVPVVNLEWIQKIHRDTSVKGRTPESVTASILRRMRDYINFIVPQFSVTDINFQRVPIVDTSNPFIACDIPTSHESIIVIRFREPARFDFPYLLCKIDGSFMSRPNTMVVPGGYMRHALEVICTPLINKFFD